MLHHEIRPTYDPVRDRTLRLAAAHADEFAHKRYEAFKTSPHLSNLTKPTIDKLIGRQWERQYRKFINDREAGLHNDSQSLGVGLLAVVNDEAVRQFQAMQRSSSPKESHALSHHPAVEAVLTAGGLSRDPNGFDQFSDLDWAALDSASSGYPRFLPTGVIDGRVLFRLDLPVGIYKQETGGLVFYTHASARGPGRIMDAFGGFKLPDETVVRIEGYSGELWQNHSYTPEGSRLES